MINYDEKGKLLEYYSENKISLQHVPYVAHVFVFSIIGTDNVADINLVSDDYIQHVCNHFGVEDVTELEKVFKNTKDGVPLYYIDNSKYTGYSLLEGFVKSDYPHRSGTSVVLDVEFAQTYVAFFLEDKTVAVRNFTRKVGEKYFPNIQKRMKFTKEIEKAIQLHNPEFSLNAQDFDFSILKGSTITYIINLVANNPKCKYPEITEIWLSEDDTAPKKKKKKNSFLED